ncbi:hypothetical protein ACJ72_06298 [Emergomyces africanus]|uniref:Uncharacterized protein n=1 Tax=Emergomyces africanus TaxID=1955775 RepID=A0A1B7NRH3_9EURO|nr:hypothetical protein ACJ72_06298 [Emergomyces africanus]
MASSNPYCRPEDHNHHFHNPPQPSSSDTDNSHSSHLSHSHLQHSLNNKGNNHDNNNNASSYNPRRDSNSNSNTNSNDKCGLILDPPQSMRDEEKDHRQPAQAHGIQPITTPPPASMLGQTPSIIPDQYQTKGEVGWSHGRGVLMSGHSSPFQHRVLGRHSDEEDDGDGRDGNDYDDYDDAATDKGEDDIERVNEDVDGLDVVRSTETENAFFILLHLSFLVPPFTLIAALYSLGVLLYVLIFALPLRLCTPSTFLKHPLSAHICSILLPLLRNHQRLIALGPRTLSSSSSSSRRNGRSHCSRYCKRSRKNGDIESTHPYDTIDVNCYHQKNITSTTTTTTSPTTTTPTTTIPHDTHLHTNKDTNTNTNTNTKGTTPASSITPSPFQSSTPPSPTPMPMPMPTKNTTSTTITTHSPLLLFLIHLVSPLLIPPLLLASWIAASFWVFTMILGNPDGMEWRDDGRVAVLGVRNWWWSWLCWPRRGRGRRKGRRGKVKEKGRERDC